jgi:hypothetical protein
VNPSVTRGTVFEDYVNVTVHARPGDHCLLFWSLAPGRTHYPLPANLGGDVNVGLDPAWVLTSTLDGGITLDDQGTWTLRIPHLNMIRELVDRLYFQVVVFRPNGSGLKAHVSAVLEVPTKPTATPKSGLQRIAEILNGSKSGQTKSDVYLGRRRSPLGERRVQAAGGTIRRDPFGNIIRRPARVGR